MSDSPLKLTEANVTDLEVVTQLPDLRQDVHVFVEYARQHEIKRGHRGNLIPRAHQQRMAKLMSDPVRAAQIDDHGWSPWFDHVDQVAYALQFVRYDTKGVYAGYTSTEPSFPDNYILVDEEKYQAFLTRSLQEQEEALLQLHLGKEVWGGNEFFQPGPLARSDPFDSWGSATGVVPTIPFGKVRRHLLELLAQSPVGVWFSTDSLVEYLRRHEPWFLIPKQIPATTRSNAVAEGRYGNFIERKRGDWGNRTPISDQDPEGFAKVEGRFIERFLEGLPLVLGYAEVAYLKSGRESQIEPCRGLVRAFRVTERLGRVIHNEITQPKVTVLPNFDVHVESLFFPAQTEAQLRPLAEVVQRGVVTVLKLTKAKVAATLAADPKQDPMTLLEALSGRPLPANVRQEISDWAGHSEKFILYEGFGLLEGARQGSDADLFIAENISANFALVRDSGRLYQRLEAAEQVPIRIAHLENALAVSAGVKSRLAPTAAPRHSPEKKRLTVKRRVQTTLWFTDAEAHGAFAKMLLDAKCVVLTDPRALSVTYPRKVEAVAKECLKKLSQQYSVTVQEIEA